MKRWMTGLAMVAAVVGLSACGDDLTGPTPIKFDGEVHELPLPGPSTWVIDRLDSDITYKPLNLPAEYQVEGVQLDIEALLVHEYKIFDLEPIEILDISPLGTGIN